MKMQVTRGMKFVLAKPSGNLFRVSNGMIVSLPLKSDLKQIAIGHIDKIGKTNENRRPPNIVNMAPKSNKRSMCSNSTPSAVEPAAKRLKTEPGSQPTDQLIGRNAVSDGTNREETALSYMSSCPLPLCETPVIAATPPRIPKIVQSGFVRH